MKDNLPPLFNLHIPRRFGAGWAGRLLHFLCQVKAGDAIVWLMGMVMLLSCSRSKKDPGSLYYFPNADTTFVGVKNGRGDIIIPALYPALNNADMAGFIDFLEPQTAKQRIFYSSDARLIPEARYDFEKPLTGLVIEFTGIAKNSKADTAGPRIPAGEVYDRQGKFLYYAAGYITPENTKGYRFITLQPFMEGYRLYVEKGKLGYVDGMGNKITPAMWEFAEPFNYGYAKVYTGRWEQIPMPGYIDYKALTDTSQILYIRADGMMIKPNKAAGSGRDYYIYEAGYLPCPFSYTDGEQQIIDSLNNIKAITYTNLVDIMCTEKEQERMCFEITARPKPGFLIILYKDTGGI